MHIKTGLEGRSPLEQTRPQTEQVKGAEKRTEAPAQAPKDAPDKVNFSEEARLRSLAMQEAQASSGTRADRIAELKAKVQNGTYEPDAKKIAQGIVREELNLII